MKRGVWGSGGLGGAILGIVIAGEEGRRAVEATDGKRDGVKRQVVVYSNLLAPSLRSKTPLLVAVMMKNGGGGGRGITFQ